MGTKKGDEIAVGSEESYGVEEVQSKYVAAHQDALRDYSINFPDDTAVRRVHFTMEDPTPVLAQLDLRHEFARGALRLYRERRMTMGTLASVLGESLIDVWLALVGAEPAERVLAAEGNEPEIQFESAAVGSASEIVLEPTAILDACSIGQATAPQRTIWQSVRRTAHGGCISGGAGTGTSRTSAKRLGRKG